MRKSSAALATISLAVLALTGCSVPATIAGDSCARADSPSTVTNAVTVEGKLGATPDAEIRTPLHAEGTSFTDVIVGDGAALTAPNQLAVVDVGLYSGDTGDLVVGTSFEGDPTSLQTLGGWNDNVPGLGDILECATAGTRVVGAIDPAEFGAEALTAFGFADDETVVVVADIHEVYPARANGSLVFNDAAGLPTVVRAADGRPGVIIPDVAPPAKQSVQTLIEGEGAEVAATDTPIVNYTAVTWSDSSVISSSWDDIPSASLASASPQAAEAVVGATVGSQVLVVVPDEAGDATVFVVDVLGVLPAASN